MDEQLIFEMGYNVGFKDGIKDSILRERIEQMVAEIRECAYDEPEGYVCFCDREPDKIVSLKDVLDIIYRYTKEQNNEID